MLILQPGLMGSMEDDHLLAALDAQPTILRTAVEEQLAWRLEGALDQLHEARGIIELSNEFDFTADDLRPVLEAHPGNFVCYAKMLAMLNDAEIESVEELEKVIQLWKEPAP